ncbi:MAG: tRNA lysidine(34) synthetase TilS, partial [Leptolyngbyaceae cyanobacterium CAN_BIN12]|nr:tRNA lysidine(34) synthetase TilS [Leptolyngbyaceae cyanobacterium CAN_BIN12]
MPWTPFHAQVHQTLRDRKLLPSSAKILIAVSGGQDSVCLAQLLLDLQPLWSW